MKRVKKSLKGLAPKVLNFFIILLMLFQPVGSPGLLRAMAADEASAEAVSAPAPAPEPTPAPAPAPDPTPVPEPTPAPTPVTIPALAPALELTPTLEPTPTPTPATDTIVTDAQPEAGIIDPEAASITPADAQAPKETWSKDGNKATTNDPVEKDVKYTAPQNEDVTVTFTKLPDNPGKLSIEEITLTDEQVASLHALSNKAYDITSDMADGTFKYDLTLPKPKDEKNVEIKFAEDVDGLKNAEKVPGSDVEIKKETVSLESDHFTIYVLTTPNPDSGQSLVINEIFVHPTTGGKEFVEIYNTTGTDINCSFGVSCRIVDAAGSEHIFTNVVPAHGFYVFEHDQGWLNNTGPETVILKDYTNNEVDRVEIQAAGIVGSVVNHYPLQGESLMRITDGNDSWSYMLGYPTKGRTNFAAQPVINNLYVSGTGASEKIYASFATNNSTVSKCYLTTGYNPFTYDGMTEIPGAMHLSSDGTTGYCYAEGLDLSSASEIGKIKVFIDYCTRGTCAYVPSATINIVSGTILDNTGPTNVSLSYPTGLKNVLYTISNGMPMNISNFSDSGVGGATEGTMIMESAPYLDGVCGTFTEVANGRSTIFPNSFYPGPYSTTAGTYWYEKLNDGLCHRFNLSVADMFGNATTYTGDTVMFDALNPVMPNVTAGVRSHVLAYFAWDLITNDYSGINHYEYAFTGGETDGILDSSWVSVPNTQNTALVDISGYSFVPNWLHIRAIDNAGNVGSERKIYMTEDYSAPNITITNPDTTPAQSKTVTAVTDEGTLTMSVNAAGISTCDDALTFIPYASTTFSLEADNTKTICYKAVDVLGNTAYSASSLIAGIDKTAPVSTATSGSYIYGTWSTSNVTITFGCTDSGAGCETTPAPYSNQYPYHCLDTANTCTPDTPTHDLVISGEGTWYVRYFGRDNVGNSETIQSVEVKIDKTSTGGSITSPIGGALLKGIVTILADAVDALSGIAKVQFFHSSPVGVKIGEDSTSPYSIDWNTNDVLDGIHTLWVEPVDNAGNASTRSAMVSVTVDNNPPVIDSHSAVTAEATSASGATIDYGTSNAVDTINGTFLATCTPPASSLFPLGITTVTCNASDAAGNAAVPTAFNVTVQDTTGPVISGTPSNMTVEADSTSGAAVTFTDPTANDDVDGAVAVTCVPPSGSTFPLGITTVSCSATDAAGNTGTSGFNVTVQDTTPPTTSANGYTFGTWTNQDVNVSLSCLDGGSGCQNTYWCYDDGSSACIPGVSGLNFQTNMNSFLFNAPGHWYLRFYSDDNAGNDESVQTKEIMIDKAAPNATVSYDITTLTNTDVIATLNPSEPVTVINNGGSTTYTFTDNGTFTFEFADAAGNTGTAVATVTNIDKTAPTVTFLSPTPDDGDITNNHDQTFKVSLNEDVSSCNLIASNGDFENGLNGWNVGGNVALTTGDYHSANHSLLLQTTNDNQGSSYNYAYANANLPGSGLINLGAWIRRSTQDSIHWDQQRIYLTDSLGNMLTDLLYTLGNVGWANVNYDISGYAGQSVRAYFAVHDDGAGDPSRMWVDDVSITGGLQGGEHSMVVNGREATLDWNDMPDGNYNYYVECADIAGNNGDSESRTLTMDTAAPSLDSKTTFSGWYTTDQASTFNYSDVNEIVSGTPVTCDIITEGLGQTCSVTPNVCDNAGNCNTTPVTSNGADIDKSVPTPSANPPAGDYGSDQFVTLTDSEDGSGLAGIFFTTDGSAPDNTSTPYTTPITVDHDMTIKTIAYDNLGNVSDVLTAVYGIAPVISTETSSAVTTSTATITWETDIPATSRVIYDTVSHASLGAAPNYGYANSTTEDSTKVTSHSVGLTGLSSGTTYYYRTISHGSPEAVSQENSFTTSKASSNNGDNNDGRNLSAAERRREELKRLAKKLAGLDQTAAFGTATLADSGGSVTPGGTVEGQNTEVNQPGTGNEEGGKVLGEDIPGGIGASGGGFNWWWLLLILLGGPMIYWFIFRKKRSGGIGRG